MGKIDWCRGQKNGLRLVSSDSDIAQGYLKMAKDSLEVMGREKDKSLIFGVSAGYYSIYYSLYAVMQKIGIKSEIHSCSIAFVKKFFEEFYSSEDFDLIEIAFGLRNTLQYYVGRDINEDSLKRLWVEAYDFFVKSRDVLVRLSEGKVKEIREAFDAK